MATVSERHAGGRPRTRQASKLFIRIQKIADTRGMHLDELAERAGIAVATLYQINDPKVSTMLAISAALGVTLDQLVSEPRRSARRASA